MIKLILMVVLAARAQEAPPAEGAAPAEVPPAPRAQRTHTVVKGDYLWKLAKHYYDNHYRWKAIYAANQDKIKDPHWIYPKQVFVIPDLPDPAIGEVGARPVEASAPAAEPEPDLGPPEPAPEGPQEMTAVDGSRPSLSGTDDLSTRMPPGMAGGYPSTARYKMARDWREDGVITGFEDAEGMAAEGNLVLVKLSAPLESGAEVTLYRRDAPEELDEDKKAVYLLRIGRARVERAGGGKEPARLLVTASADAILQGDLVKREAR